MRTAFIAFVLTLYLFTNVAAHDAKRELANQSFKNVSGVLDGVDFIRTTLEKQGFRIVATIDHQAGARSVDLELRPTQVIIFNLPQFDKALIVRKHIAALDHLHKFLVFEDEHGDIQLRLNPPGFLIDRHEIPLGDRLITKFNRQLTQFVRLDNGISLVKSSQSVGLLKPSSSYWRFSGREDFVSQPS